MYICMYAYISLCVYIYIYIHIHIYVYIVMFTYICNNIVDNTKKKLKNISKKLDFYQNFEL